MGATVVIMPELPEVEALAAYLRERAVGHRIARIDVAAISALKTFDPPLSRRTGGRSPAASRHGKFLDIELDGGELHLVMHLARAGWLHYRDALAPAPLQAGQGPDRAAGAPGRRLRLRPDRSGHAEEARRLPGDRPDGGARRVPARPGRPRRVPRRFAGRAPSRRGQVKGVLTDQEVLAGIGNAYSDEILHAAKLSPFAITDRLTDEQMAALYAATREVLTRAVERSVGQGAAELKGEKRSGLGVHARTGLPCPVCGETIREVSFADSSLQYCPGCQTGGKPLADRRLSRLIR